MATYRLPFQLYLQVYLSSLVQQIKVPVYANILMVFHYFKRNYIFSVPNKSTCFPFPPNYPLYGSLQVTCTAYFPALTSQFRQKNSYY